MATKNNNDREWDELTDSFITGIDDKLLVDSDVKLRDVLTHPSKYAQKSNASSILEKMQSSIDTYFGIVMEAFKSEKDKFDKELEAMSILYSKVSSTIQEKAELSQTPIITPHSINVNEKSSESIIIDSFDTQVEHLIGKLTSSSVYIGDISAKYNEHTLGSWIFSSKRPYILTIKPPENIIMEIENAKLTIMSYISSFSGEIELYKSSK
ncbi:MAG: hypothetical protein ACP5M9_00645 [Candidatus Micrarchaeia archaeon]